MAWKIDRDYLETPGSPDSNVGCESVEPLGDGPRYRFRLKDDDGVVYYGGVLDLEHDDDGPDWESSPYGADKWGAYYAGCTELEMHMADAIAAGLSSKRYQEATNRSDTDWVPIYG
jgi:hypothetical protein